MTVFERIREVFMAQDEKPEGTDGIAPKAQDTMDRKAPGAFRPVTTQAELDRIIGRRVMDLKKLYADYPDLAHRAETAKARAIAAEGRLTVVDAQRVREARVKDVAKRHGIPVEALAPVGDEELDAYAEILARSIHEHHVAISLPVVATEGMHLAIDVAPSDFLREAFLGLR
jgi:hypothetical protein